MVAIAFRDSDPVSDRQSPLPHTFVTYEIDEVLHGRSSSRRLTLRFLGGWSGQSGRIMLVPHAPLFKIGDRDVVFVSGNGEVACPLVACFLGRFRIWQDAIYNDAGLAVRLNPDGRLQFGPDRLPGEQLTMEFPPAPASRLRAVRQQIEQDNDLSVDERETLRRRLRDMSATRVISRGREVSQGTTTAPSTPPLSAERFKAFIVEISEGYPVSGDPMPTVSPDEPFEYPEQVLRNAEPPTRIPQPRTLTLEQQLLQQNHGNPVLRTQ